MSVRGWELIAWPEVRWMPPADPEGWPRFHHMGTTIRETPDDIGRRVGDTVWVTRVQGGERIGVTWEWVEVQPGVLAIRDPNGVYSNARLLRDDGGECDELHAITLLNLLAHRTDWQHTVKLVTAHSLGQPLTTPLQRRAAAGAAGGAVAAALPIPLAA